MQTFIHDHPWLANFIIGVLGGISAITLNQVLAVVTISLAVVNLFFTVRDKWWRDPIRKARRRRLRR